MIIAETHTEFKPPTVARRIQAEQREEQLVAAFKRVFPHVERFDLRRALNAIAAVEQNMVGRHCGDLGDKLSQYLSIVEFVRATGVNTIDSLEIGTLFGGSALTKLSAMRDLNVKGRVVCIDPLKGFYDEDVDSITGLPVNPQIIYENLRRFGFDASQVEIRRFLSSDTQAWSGLQSGHFGHLMIDGDHSFAGVQGDWQQYNQFVAPGGIVIFDDYADHRWPDITEFGKYVDQTLDASWKASKLLGTSIILQKAQTHPCRHPPQTAATSNSPSPSVSPDHIDAAMLALLLGEIRQRLETAVDFQFSTLFARLAGAFDCYSEEAVSDLLLLGRHLHHKGLCDLEREFLRWLLDACRFEGVGRIEVATTLARIDKRDASWIEAQRAVDSYLALNEQNSRRRAVAWTRKGECAIGLGHKDETRLAYITALAEEGLQAKARYVLLNRMGLMTEQDGQLEEATDFFARAMALDDLSSTERSKLHAALARIQSRQKDWDAAFEHLTEAIALSEAGSDEMIHLARTLCCTALNQGSIGTAEGVLKHILRLMDSALLKVEFAQRFAEMCRHHRDFPRAIHFLSEALEASANTDFDSLGLATEMIKAALQSGDRNLLSISLDRTLATKALDSHQKRQLATQTRHALAQGNTNGKG